MSELVKPHEAHAGADGYVVICVSMPAHVLRRIDELARISGVSRSAWIRVCAVGAASMGTVRPEGVPEQINAAYEPAPNEQGDEMVCRGQPHTGHAPGPWTRCAECVRLANPKAEVAADPIIAAVAKRRVRSDRDRSGDVKRARERREERRRAERDQASESELNHG